MRSDRAVHFAAFAAFAAWTLYRVFTHVPWRDELQALLIAREADGIAGLYQNLAYEGHPGLWHLLLMAVSQISGDPAILAWVQAPIALGILALIWFAMPFGWLEKTLLSASYYVSFEYGIMARAYGLGVMLFFGAVALRHSPWAWVLLGLMANISIHFMLLGGVLGLLLLWRGQRSRWGIAACLGLVAIAIVTAWPPAGMVPGFPQAESGADRLLRELAYLSAALIPIDIENGQTAYWNGLFRSAGSWGLLALGLLTVALGVASIRGHSRALVLLFCAGLLAIGVGLFNGWHRHYGLVLILLVGLHWISRHEGARRSVILASWLFVSAVAGAWTAYWSTGVPFSESRNMAEWVRSRGLQSEPWAAYPGVYGTELSAYLAIPTYNVEAERRNTFMRWNYPSLIKRSAGEVAELLRRAPPAPFYLVSELGWLEPSLIAGLNEQGVEINEVARFDTPGAIFKFVAYHVTIAH